MASLQSLLEAKDKQLQDQMKRGAQNSSDIGRANFPGYYSSFPFKVALHEAKKKHQVTTRLSEHLLQLLRA